MKIKDYKFRLEINGDDIPSLCNNIPEVKRKVKKATKILSKDDAQKLFWDDWMSQKTEQIPIEIWFINENKEVVKILRYEDD